MFDDQDVPLTLFVVNEKEKKEFVQANDTDPLIDWLIECLLISSNYNSYLLGNISMAYLNIHICTYITL